MSVFFTDSNSELWFNKVESLGIEYISMPYTINEVEMGYDLGKNHNFKQFYDQIKKGAMPKTSALNPENYIEIFEPFLKSGNDIIYVHFSSALSATFEFMNTAIKILKEKYPDRSIKTVDTLNISLGAGIIAYEAAKLHNSGASDDEVIKFVEKFREKMAVYFIVDDLHHLKRGGRISSALAIIGTMLSVKPILKVNKEGKIINFSKTSGLKKAINELAEKVRTERGNGNYPIGILNAEAEKEALTLKQKIEEIVGKNCEIWVQPIGPTVGTHCGPGTLGVAFYTGQ